MRRCQPMIYSGSSNHTARSQTSFPDSSYSLRPFSSKDLTKCLRTRWLAQHADSLFLVLGHRSFSNTLSKTWLCISTHSQQKTSKNSVAPSYSPREVPNNSIKYWCPESSNWFTRFPAVNCATLSMAMQRWASCPSHLLSSSKQKLSLP